MNTLTKHETVWLQAFTATISALGANRSDSISVADYALKQFQDRFPPSPPPQKETVSDVDQRTKDFNACTRALADVPSQDNEGYQPDRGSFKTGWFAALRYVRGEE